MFLVKNENLGIAKANFLTLSETNKDHADQKQREDVATRDSLEAGRQVSQHEAMAAHNARMDSLWDTVKHASNLSLNREGRGSQVTPHTSLLTVWITGVMFANRR